MKIIFTIFISAFTILSYSQNISEEEIYNKGVDYLIEAESARLQSVDIEEKERLRKSSLKSALHNFNQIIQIESYSHYFVLSLLKIAGIYASLGDTDKSIKYYSTVLKFNKLTNEKGLVTDWREYSLYKNWAANGLINHYIALGKYEKALELLQKEETEYRLYIGATCGSFINDLEQAKLSRYLRCYVKLNKINEAFQIIQGKQIEVNNTDIYGLNFYGIFIPFDLYVETIKKKFSSEEIQDEINTSLQYINLDYYPEIINDIKDYTPIQKQNIDINNCLFVSVDFFGTRLIIYEPNNKFDFDTPSKKFILGEVNKEAVLGHYKNVLLESKLIKELQD